VLVPRPRASRPALATVAALLAAGLSAVGCVSIPSGGPVQSYPVTQGPDAQNQPYVQIEPQSPGAGWSPEQIVTGFLSASASYGNYSQIVKQYLTPDEQKDWNPYWSATVYKDGPNVASAAEQPARAKDPSMATVEVGGTVQARLQGFGTYSVPSSAAGTSSAARAAFQREKTFSLVKVGGQWRISSAPSELLLTSDSFSHDYQLSNLYFLDPDSRFLVPDPVYVPLQASPLDLMNGLVHDLITPPGDWISPGISAGATRTALPPGTKIIGVTFDGVTAVVNLTGTAIAKASTEAGGKVMEQVSAQLLWTLSGAAQSDSAGQTVKSVEVEVNGRQWTPPSSQSSQGGAVQLQSTITPASGGTSVFYYVDGEGDLTSRDGTHGTSVSIARIGTGFKQIAVSPDGKYLAALRGTTLYTGLIGGGLAKRGTGYQTISWDVNDDLWVSTGTQILMLRSGARKGLSPGPAVPVEVSGPSEAGPFTALRVAPDGVRVAIVVQGSELTFGAISGRTGPAPLITLSPVQFSPVDNATVFTGLTWYGSGDVITLAQQPGASVTDYPVSGGAPKPIPVDSDMQTISASYNNQLVGTRPKASMVADASLTGSWLPIGSGTAPTYPG
jgi:Lipoprotein LpqB beta-propeller domain/Sporulation and spore germination